jgi:hypothetical protein
MRTFSGRTVTLCLVSADRLGLRHPEKKPPIEQRSRGSSSLTHRSGELDAWSQESSRARCGLYADFPKNDPPAVGDAASRRRESARPCPTSIGSADWRVPLPPGSKRWRGLGIAGVRGRDGALVVGLRHTARQGGKGWRWLGIAGVRGWAGALVVGLRHTARQGRLRRTARPAFVRRLVAAARSRSASGTYLTGPT